MNEWNYLIVNGVRLDMPDEEFSQAAARVFAGARSAEWKGPQVGGMLNNEFSSR